MTPRPYPKRQKQSPIASWSPCHQGRCCWPVVLHQLTSKHCPCQEQQGAAEAGAGEGAGESAGDSGDSGAGVGGAGVNVH